MTPVRTLVYVELAKLFRRPMTWILALLFVGISIVVYGVVVGMILVAESSFADQVGDIDAESLRESILLPAGVFFGGTLVNIVGSVVLIILAAGSIGSDFTWATFRTGVFMGASRGRMLLSKFLSLGIVSLIAIFLGLALTLLLSGVSELIVGRGQAETGEFTAGFAGDVLITIGVSFFAILVWVFISGGITLVTHSLATGLGLTLVLTFLGGQVALLIAQLGSVGTWISRVFPNTATNEIGTLLSTNPPDLAATDWAWVALNIAGWSALMLVVSIMRFRRMDLLATS